MEPQNTGLESLLTIIDSSKPTYIDPATGEELHNTGIDTSTNPAPDLSEAVIIPFPLHRILGK